jgi:hypothetical protein
MEEEEETMAKSSKIKYVEFRMSDMWLNLKLINFPVNSAVLQKEHKNCLNDIVVYLLQSDPNRTFIILGMTSRSGSEKHNEILSERRARAVYDYLSLYGLETRGDPRFGDMHWYGERIARSVGQRDGTEDGNFRAVRVLVFNNLAFPPFAPPTELDPEIETGAMALIRSRIRSKLQASSRVA